MTAAALSGRARQDLDQAARWIARASPTAARNLRAAVVDSARRIGRFPGLGTERPDLAQPPARFLPVQGFSYLLVYDPDPPVILRILHGARDLPEVLRDLGG